MDWSHTISVLVGALVAGVLSFLGSRSAVERQLRQAREIEADRQENLDHSSRKERKAREKRIIFDLMAEIKDNLENTDDDQYSVPILTDAWNQYKGDLDFFDQEHVDKLRTAYNRCFQFNLVLGLQGYGL